MTSGSFSRPRSNNSRMPECARLNSRGRTLSLLWSFEARGRRTDGHQWPSRSSGPDVPIQSSHPACNDAPAMMALAFPAVPLVQELCIVIRRESACRQCSPPRRSLCTASDHGSPVRHCNRSFRVLLAEQARRRRRGGCGHQMQGHQKAKVPGFSHSDMGLFTRHGHGVYPFALSQLLLHTFARQKPHRSNNDGLSRTCLAKALSPCPALQHVLKR